MASPAPAIDPEEILRDLLRVNPGLRRERYYRERAIFYNPGGAAPLGVIFASIKDDDGPHDRSAELSREGVYRFAFAMTPATFAERFGAVPPRPAKGKAVSIGDHDPTRLNQLTPHPVYAWMSWVQILAPTAAEYESLRPLLAESFEHVTARWERRSAPTNRAAAR